MWVSHSVLLHREAELGSSMFCANKIRLIYSLTSNLAEKNWNQVVVDKLSHVVSMVSSGLRKMLYLTIYQHITEHSNTNAI